MKKAFSNLLRITVLATILSLAGLVMSGAVMAQQCVDNGNGTVTDNSTGFMWQKETAGSMNWQNAMSFAASLSLGGKTGWRLPSRQELITLYSSPCKSQMSVVSFNYWSSTTWSERESYAWLVNFSNGDVSARGYKSYSYYVRAIRAAQ
ncbi:MAG: DUF1566 domain-containing protein [Trichlorobacter sp.]|uniref:Lcl C-terminal domain-containing protein n=1 Tax=Trichlorobacter sp. TaxID=2911007 RepID=UPI00256375E6|nr:DUF1566 domain-containing protein [Trichlorobacter sp.]MDK9717634.1 DUF1566 domain-containing protein [Trichlorobacter sp.]